MICEGGCVIDFPRRPILPDPTVRDLPVIDTTWLEELLKAYPLPGTPGEQLTLF